MFVPVLAVSVACAAGSTTRRSPGDVSVLTHEQLEERHYENVLEAVQSLRSNWLIDHGPDSYGSPSRILVYLDNSRLGGVQALAQISTRYVSSIRRVNGIDATARWGSGHSAGVIALTTWSPQDAPPVAVPAPRGDSASASRPDSTARRPD
jgi:hypothetical protein